MVGVAVGGAAQVLAEDVGATRLRVLQRLHAQHARALAHHKAVAALVPWPRRLLRLVIARGQRSAQQIFRAQLVRVSIKTMVRWPDFLGFSSRGDSALQAQEPIDLQHVGAYVRCG